MRRKLFSIALALALVIGVMPMAAPAYAAATPFGSTALYGPASLSAYPQAGDSYELKGETVTLASDGDVEYLAEYQLDGTTFDNYKAVIQGMLNQGDSYRRLVDLFRYEFIGDLDAALEPRMDGANYVYTFTSSFLEVDEENISVSGGTFTVPCVPKLKFADKTGDEDLFTALKSAMSLRATVAFKSEAAYESARDSSGQIVSGGRIRVYPPEEAQTRLDSNGNYESRLMQLLITMYGADALQGTHPNKYLEISAEDAVTELTAPSGGYVKIDTSGNYKMHSDGHAIFWLANAASASIDLPYTVYTDADCTVKSQNDVPGISWTIGAAGSFDRFDLSAAFDTTLPVSARTATWAAADSGSQENNTVTLYSARSAVYKLTVTLGEESDYCYVVVPGDLNRDSYVRANDATLTMKYSQTFPAANGIPDDDFTMPLADMNCDHYVRANDASAIFGVI